MVPIMDATPAPDISVTRASTQSIASSVSEHCEGLPTSNGDSMPDHPSPSPGLPASRSSPALPASSATSGRNISPNSTPPPPTHANTNHTNRTYHASSSPWWRSNKTGDTPRHRRSQSPDVDWHIKWTKDAFPNGRVLVIDYVSNASNYAASPGTRHIAVAAQEFRDLKELERFYADPKRARSAALRVVHVQNATWATLFLLKKFNIDYPNEIVGMQGFSKWARYEKPRQRDGKPYPNGRAFREQTDPWRNISRTAFGLDYLKPYTTAPPTMRRARSRLGHEPIDAKMMHLNAHDDSRSPHGWDVSVQRLSVYIQRSLGSPCRVSPDIDIRNPYRREPDGHTHESSSGEVIDLESLDSTNTVIVFETSASMLLEDCLVQPRQDFERRWRRLSFYLKKEEALNDARLAAQCTNMILGDVFHGLAVVWDDFLSAATDHVNLLEDKVYDNPADESRAPELWTNQAMWLKVDKVMWIHQDLVKQMQIQLKALAEFDVEDEEPITPPDWLASTLTEYEKLGHTVQEDLVQPVANLSDLMYKSVGIRDSRQSLQLGLSMWRLSWITFVSPLFSLLIPTIHTSPTYTTNTPNPQIFLPLTFMVSFFGMNVATFSDPLPGLGWWFLAATILMLFVLALWYCVKHSLQRSRQTPYQRGLYEHLFATLRDAYPQIWSSRGAIPTVAPKGLLNRLKWRLIRTWFAPKKTVDRRLYSSLAPEGSGDDDADIGAWARVKRLLLKRWLPGILADTQSTKDDGDPISLAEIGGLPFPQQLSSTSHNTFPDTQTQTQTQTLAHLAQTSTPLFLAEAEPAALQQQPQQRHHHQQQQQQLSEYGLQRLHLVARGGGAGFGSGSGSNTPRQSLEGRPSSCGSSGLMIEEMNLSDSDNEAGEGATRAGAAR